MYCRGSTEYGFEVEIGQEQSELGDDNRAPAASGWASVESHAKYSSTLRIAVIAAAAEERLARVGWAAAGAAALGAAAAFFRVGVLAFVALIFLALIGVWGAVGVAISALATAAVALGDLGVAAEHFAATFFAGAAWVAWAALPDETHLGTFKSLSEWLKLTTAG